MTTPDETRPEPKPVLTPWADQVRFRLGGPPLRFSGASDHLLAEVLRVHGLLLAYVARHGGAPVAAEEGLTPGVLEGMIAVAEDEAEARGVVLPLRTLVRRFGLSPSEREALTIAVARAVSAGTGALVADAHGARERDLPTVALVTALVTGEALFTPPPTELFGGRARLVANGLVRLATQVGSPSDLLVDRVVLPSNAVVAYLQGSRMLSPPLDVAAELRRPRATLVDLVAEEPALRTLEALALSLDAYLGLSEGAGGGRAVFAPKGVMALLSGPLGCGTTLAAEAVAGTAGRDLLLLSGVRLAGLAGAPELIDSAFAHAALLDAIVCLDDAEVLLAQQGPSLAAVLRGAERYRGLTLLTATHPEKLAAEIEPRLVFQVRLDRPDPSRREQLWESHLAGGLASDVPGRLPALAAQYELTGAQVRNAVASAFFRAARRAPTEPLLGADDLDLAARDQLRVRLEDAGERRSSRFGLEAIVLPKETGQSVREFLDGCRHRTAVLNEWGFGRKLSTGKGIVALFTGDPGTGKTYCAELLANELGMALHVVSIPNVMSKWVGETEQNIARLFSHARAQNTMLMFDEADALFTTRVKVETASDRFSNMEVNQLLQEIDRFEGIVVLTTNLESSIDRAFKRRVAFHVNFPMPDAEVREQIWRTLLPAEAPVEGVLDFAELAYSYELAGGHIKNILVRAAYRARARGRSIGMALLHEVAEDECRAAGKLYRKSERTPPTR